MAEGERDASSSRIASLTDDDLNQLIDDRDSKNTKNVITVSRKALNDYLKEKDGILKFVDEMDSAQRADVVTTLRKFYGEVRKSEGTLYAKKSLVTLRFGLQKHFFKTRKEDIINNEHYDEANVMLEAMMVKLKKEGKGVVKHKEPILPEDLQNCIIMTVFHCSLLNRCKRGYFFNISTTFVTGEERISEMS